MSTLETEFKAFLEDTLALSLDEFLSGLELPDNVAKRLGNMTREDVGRMLGSLTPAGRAGLVAFSQQVLRCARTRRASSLGTERGTEAVRSGTGLWDWKGLISTES